MYHWLICYYKGDAQKATDRLVALDESKAVALLSQEGGTELIPISIPERPIYNALESADLAHHF